MKSTSRISCLLLMSTMILSATELQAQKLNLLIGTYTKPGKSEGIYVYEFDTKTGKSIYKNKATGLNNPSYLALSKDEKHVYAVSEAGPGKGGASAFAFDKKTGALSFLNTKPSVGNGPCYIAVGDQSKHIFLANYGGGSLTAIPVNADGSLGDTNQHIKYEGGSVNKDRQSAPHVHSTVLSPDNKFLFVSDLGTDRINIYRYNSENQETPLTSAGIPFVSVIPGSGPRHFDFHPNHKFAYSIQEMSGNVSVFKYNNGSLELLENISSIPPDYKGNIWSADIHVSPDGKFLYTSTRDQLNEIVIFKIDKSSGKLTLAGRHSSLGKAPRNFVIDPSGNFLLVANQNSDNIVVLKRDKTTGLLKNTGEELKIASPVCLKFASN